MHLHHFSIAVLTVSVLSGCASAPQTDTAEQTASQSAAASGVPGALQWSAQLRATQQRTGRAAPTAQNKAYGNVSLAQVRPGRTHVRLAISTPIQSSTTLQWGFHPGSCGSGSPPIVGMERFPVIEIGTGGRGELDAEMPLTLPASGSFHVNVYQGGDQLNHVLTCGNLRRAGG